MHKPRLLDLFCKAGGASEGYERSGFEVWGVDRDPQPIYPHQDRFILADALTVDLRPDFFDAYAASPPCQKYTKMQSLGKARNGSYGEHPDLIGKIRERLSSTGKPYVIENVVGAPLINPIRLCGSMFGLHVYRHRLFESNVPLVAPPHYPHRDKTPSAGNGKSPKGFISVCGTGGVRGMTAAEIVEYWRYAMGIDWMDRETLREAIPPAYTECIGRQVIEYLRAR